MAAGSGDGQPTRSAGSPKRLRCARRPSPSTRPAPRLSRPRRALYLSSPIGLGHARRDLAVARRAAEHAPRPAGRLARPGPGDPGAAETPASGCTRRPGQLASESGHVEHESGEHDLHAFRAIRRMDEILVNNFMVFDELTESEHYDLVIGDEAWDVDYFLHENPELKRSAYAWFTDFVGWLPMPDGGAGRGRADRRLQRRDDRAAGPVPPPAGPVDLRRQPRRHRARHLRPGPARDPGLDRGATSTSPAT